MLPRTLPIPTVDGHPRRHPHPADACDAVAWTAWIAIASAGVAVRPSAATLLALAVAPWVEEVLFRRGLQDGLATRFGDATAVVATAVAFAVAHAVVAAVDGAGPSGIALAAATLLPALVVGGVHARTGSLAACVALHAAANAAWLAIVGASGLTA